MDEKERDSGERDESKKDSAPHAGATLLMMAGLLVTYVLARVAGAITSHKPPPTVGYPPTKETNVSETTNDRIVIIGHPDDPLMDGFVKIKAQLANKEGYAHLLRFEEEAETVYNRHLKEQSIGTIFCLAVRLLNVVHKEV